MDETTEQSSGPRHLSDPTHDQAPAATDEVTGIPHLEDLQDPDGEGAEELAPDSAELSTVLPHGTNIL